MKIFKDVEDGEVFVLCNGQQLIKVNEGAEYNAIALCNMNKGFKISNEQETFTVDEFWGGSVEVQE